MARRILRRRRTSPNQKTILRLLPGEALTLDSRMVGKPYLGITSDRRDSWNLGQHVAKIPKNGQTKTQISRPSRVQSPVPFVWGFEAYLRSHSLSAFRRVARLYVLYRGGIPQPPPSWNFLSALPRVRYA